MDRMNDCASTLADVNPDNGMQNGIPTQPEINQPDPSIATPSIPAEMPIRES